MCFLVCSMLHLFLLTDYAVGYQLETDAARLSTSFTLFPSFAATILVSKWLLGVQKPKRETFSFQIQQQWWKTFHKNNNSCCCTPTGTFQMRTNYTLRSKFLGVFIF